MKIYHYDSTQGFLTSAGLADADPLQPDSWLVPSHATPITPPTAPDGCVAVFGKDAWRVFQDVRGTWYTASGQEQQVDHVGASVAGLVRAARPTACHTLVDGAWQLSPALVSAALGQAKNSRLNQFRSTREITLNRLMGMAISAILAGDNATAKACQDAKRQLLDITKHTEVVTASSLAELDSVLTACQGAISQALPASARAAFAGLQL